MSNRVTYWDYLKLEELLSLQQGLDEGAVENVDELHFIVVHQVFELWFKLMLQELRLARNKMSAPKVEEVVVPHVVHHLKRVNTILDLSAKHFKLMETLTPQDFLKFRSKLGTASGFQSFQLREIEFVMGLGQEQRNAQKHGDPSRYIMETAKGTEFGQKIMRRMQTAKEEISLREAIHKWLYRTPIHGSSPTNEGDKKVVTNFIDSYLDKVQKINEIQAQKLIEDGEDASRIKLQFEQNFQNAREFLFAKDYSNPVVKEKMSRIRAAILFIESYRELPLLAWPRLLIDTIVEMEELMIAFRFHHARMVERIIGRRVGTGGSSGVDYLDETTKYRVFPELWAVRTILLSREQLPDLQQKEFYSFVTEINQE